MPKGEVRRCFKCKQILRDDEKYCRGGAFTWTHIGSCPSAEKKAIRIDPTNPFLTTLDLTKFVKKLGSTFVCSKCDEVLVKVEPGGVLGDKLNQLDTTVILDHHIAKHPG